MTRRWHIRRAKIQREAEGYLELGMPEQALQTLGRLGDPARFERDALYLWGEGLRTMRALFRGAAPLGTGRQGRTGRYSRPHRTRLVLQTDRTARLGHRRPGTGIDRRAGTGACSATTWPAI